MIEFSFKYIFESRLYGIHELFLKLPANKKSFTNENLEAIVWGDPIIPEDFAIGTNPISLVNQLIEHIGGHFYYVILNRETDELYLGSSIFSILPVYYFKNNTTLFISSSPELIRQSSGDNFTISKSFILERLLFNYPFSGNCLFSEIQCLASNTYLLIKGSLYKEVKHTDITKWFITTPTKGRKVLTVLSEKFIEQAKRYLPVETYSVSFTSGFDGRTLLALSTYYKKNFITYSFGRKNAEDIIIPAIQSKKLQINYESILLDNETYLSEALECGIEFSLLSNGNGNWARAHYLYTAKKISKRYNYLLTGNFGSELFRSFHSPGVMVTPFLFELFCAQNPKSLIEDLEKRTELRFLNLSEFQSDITVLKVELLKYFNNSRALNKNQVLYKYLLEEVFRKYFGAEIVAQSAYLINRTPFLDYCFVKELFKTKYAGVYSDFSEKNPFKRFKGQIIYAYILKKTNQQIYSMLTGKGYSPSNLLNFSGRLRIIYSFLKKKFKMIVEVKDPFAVQLVYNRNKNKIAQIDLISPYFLNEKWKKEISQIEHYDNTVINYLSLNKLIEVANAKL